MSKLFNEVKHHSGFVNIIGNPNVGKSTLMNALVGEKLSIVTAKMQTTRHRIMGIVNGENYQIIFSDTPGIITPSYKLQESMMSFVKGALSDADIILYVTDTIESPEKRERELEWLSKEEQRPVLVVINKIDLTTEEKLEELYSYWHERLPNAKIFPISATEKFNLKGLFEEIVSLLPENPAWYDKETLTDKNLRFFASEIIREKILVNYSQEIPYATEVVIESFKEEEPVWKIGAVIYVARDSQKGIIIGREGKMLKKVATQARLEMEAFFEKRVYLEIFVKVDAGWRENESKLKRFGYLQ